MRNLSKIMVVILPLCLTWLLAACSSRSAASLEGTQWSLVSFAPGSPMQSKIKVGQTTLMLEAGNKVRGKAACNSYGGSYVVKGETMRFHEINSTLMACADPVLMEQESAFLAALATSGKFTFANDRLVIYYNGGNDQLTFERAGVPPADTP